MEATTTPLPRADKATPPPRPVRTQTTTVAGCELVMRQEGSHADPDRVLTVWVLTDEAGRVVLHSAVRSDHRTLASYAWRTAKAEGEALATSVRQVVRAAERRAVMAHRADTVRGGYES